MSSKVINYITFTGENAKEVVSFYVFAKKNSMDAVRFKYNPDSKLLWIAPAESGFISSEGFCIQKGHTAVHCVLEDGRDWVDILHGPCADVVKDYIDRVKTDIATIPTPTVTDTNNDTDDTPQVTTRAGILDAAKKCVCGKREQDYGKPEDNFAVIAKLWSSYIKTEISGLDVSAMMALLKLARIKSGAATLDSFIDLAGYAACGGEIAMKSKNKQGGKNYAV